MWSRLRFSLPRVVTSSTILALAAGLCLTASASGLPAGPVFGWGYDASTQANAPLSVDGIMGNATAIAAATYQSCAIQSGTGAVICWGDDTYGESTPPDSVNGTSGGATAISAGEWDTCAIQSGTGAVVCWGNNAEGQLNVPAQVNGTSGSATAIAASGDFNCAIQSGTGAVVCWGGLNPYGEDTPPASVNGTSGSAIAIAAGTFHNCAIQSGTGAVVCWGDNFYGQLDVPASVNGTSGGATAIAAGGYHTCAIQSGTGAVVCWGDTSGGLCCLSGPTAPPASVNGTSGSATAITVGDTDSCAIQSGTGAVICWGNNFYGDLIVPDSVSGVNGSAIAVAAGTYHTLAIGRLPPVPLPLEWLPIAYPGNTADSPANCFGVGCGSVAYRYDISEYQVTNTQYAEFLNAKAASDPLGLYNPSMGSDTINGGITQSGVSGSFTYAVKSGFVNKPVTYVSFYSAQRFVNWLNNGKGAGDTETGAYTLTGYTPIPSNQLFFYRNRGATFFLPSENEWYKAAYYSPGGVYFAYPFGTNDPTRCAGPWPTPNTANCDYAVGQVTDVGSYAGSPSPFGTFDQGGNVLEWTEGITATKDSPITESVVVRGASSTDPVGILAAGFLDSVPPSAAVSTIGFRVVRIPPLPSCGLGPELSLILPALMWLRGRRRRKRQ